MKRMLLLSMVFSFVFATSSWAQRTVSGKVTDESGEGLPGVNVVIKGTTTGVTSDLDGNYQISVPDDNTVLVFSSVGMSTQEVTVGVRSVIDLGMDFDTKQLQEVVVTALGSDRNAREVVYANQTVRSDELLSLPNKNVLEALRGKTAGVKLSTGSGSVGASTRIVLRGESSLTGNNNALIVVDGVPIDNSARRGGSGSASNGYADYGNRFNDLNPDDIESVTILKGPSATSLYGSRGSSGVLLITTKKGQGSSMKIRLNSSYSQERAYILQKRQNRFGQGYDSAHLDTGENWSWGPAFDGVVRPWTSPIDSDGDGSLEALTRPYSAVPNQLQELFNIGRTVSNSISLSGANNGFTYYASYSNVDQVGILENTKYKRNTLRFNASAQLSEKLKSDFKVSYARVNINTAQEGSRPFEENNAYAMAIQSPVNIPFGELRDYKSPFHDTEIGYWGSYSSTNPYFILNEYGNEGEINNLLTSTSVSYEIMEGLNIVGRVGVNVVNTAIETWKPSFTPAPQLIWGDDLALTTRSVRGASLGDYVYSTAQTTNLDISTLVNYSRTFTDDWSLNVSVGYNLFEREVRSVSGRTKGGLVVKGVYNLANSKSAAESSQGQSKYRIYGVLGNVRFAFRDAVYLEYSARNDVSSTLPEANNDFFYNAVGISAVINDLLDINDDVLSFFKVRASVGTSGKDAGLYLLNSSFIGNPTIAGLGDYTLDFPLNGQPGYTVSNAIGSPDLQPELTTTYEAGVDIGLLDERINISYTYYISKHADQIVSISLPRSTGFTTTSSNIGKITNKGHEFTLGVKPIHGLVDGLDLEIFGTYSENTSKVNKVADDIDELAIGGATGIVLVAKKGKPFGTYKALAPQTNDDGKIIVSSTGFPLYTDEEVYLGSYQPDYLASFGANVNYKGIGFNILFDLKQGGSFISQTKFLTEFNGTALHTTLHDRAQYIFPNAVIENEDGTFEDNEVLINEQDYFTNYDPAASTFLVDASYLKLREIGVSYDLPSQVVNTTPFSSVRIVLFGKNLKFWLPDENTFSDPEVNGPALTGNSQGIETSQTPPAKSFGVNLQLTF